MPKELKERLSSATLGKAILSILVFIATLIIFRELGTKFQFFFASDVILLVVLGLSVFVFSMFLSIESRFFKNIGLIIKGSVLISFGVLIVVEIMGTFVVILTKSSRVEILLALALTVVGVTIIYFDEEITKTLNKIFTYRRNDHIDSNNIKYYSNLFNKRISDGEKFSTVRLMLNKTQSELIDLDTEESDPVNSLLVNIRTLSETLSKIDRIQDKEIRNKVISSALAVIKVDYVAFLNVYNLSLRYDLSDRDMVYESEIERVSSRYVSTNADCDKLFCLARKVVAERLSSRTEAEREDARRIISNTFKMM